MKFNTLLVRREALFVVNVADFLGSGTSKNSLLVNTMGNKNVVSPFEYKSVHLTYFHHMTQEIFIF